ncbi:hypothetical protein B0H10DRAFT_2041946 [Mycena sp. CBHHK59/15]|nr:hypothetical protein B0H10DRAFT_2041946 [Mycena sp. CBHHK59/15]
MGLTATAPIPDRRRTSRQPHPAPGTGTQLRIHAPGVGPHYPAHTSGERPPVTHTSAPSVRTGHDTQGHRGR